MEKGYDHIFNSMAIDEYFDYRYGALPYRSIKFHNVLLPMPKIFDVATVNFTHDGPFTRVTEWKNFPEHGNNDCFTTLTYEEPCDYKDNNYERYYPVKTHDDKYGKIYNKYKKIDKNKIQFIGRCGTYQYLDMHQVVNQSLINVSKWIKSNE